MRLRERWQTALVLHGVTRLGAVPFPIDADLPERQTASLLEQSGASDCIADGDARPAASGATMPADMSPRPAEAVQLLVATSGSGGMPKGVMLTGVNLCAAVEASASRLTLEPGGRWLNALPLHHIGGLAILYRCLAAGAEAVLHEGFDAGRVWEALQTQGITHISLVPAMLARLLEAAEGVPPPTTLRHVLIGGAALDPWLAERARGWPLCVSYGMSETGSQLATDCEPLAGRQKGRVGHPLPGFEVRITGGCVEVRGPAVMAGYVNPELTPGEGLRDGWFITPDLGEMDTSGALRITGRADRMLVSGGENVDPGLVEGILEQCPGVEQAGVTAVDDPVWGDRLVAFIAGTASSNVLRNWCREHLPSSHRPRGFVAVPRLPRSALGKLQRARLRAWAERWLADSE